VSCAHVISKESLTGATSDVQFASILKNTEAHLNNTFVFGGIISETTLTGDGSEIEVVQTPLDRFGAIIDRDISEGRFIVKASKKLDPLIYKEGREITIAGRLTGSRKKMLGDVEYKYPVFESKEIYLWREDRYYAPYLYYSDPYYYDPFFYPYSHYWYYPTRHRYNYPYSWWYW
jgi:outer membrane lipoprotein